MSCQGKRHEEEEPLQSASELLEELDSAERRMERVRQIMDSPDRTEVLP